MVAKIPSVTHKKVPSKYTARCPKCGTDTKIYISEGWKDPYYITHCGVTTLFERTTVDKNGCGSFI